MKHAIEQDTLPTRIAIVKSAGGSEHAVSLRSADNVCAALQHSFSHTQIFPFDTDLKNDLLAWQPDVVFPVAHGAGGESGELQALLESMALPFVGSGAASSALCWDKTAANTRVAEWLASTPTLPADFDRCTVPAFTTLRPGDDIPKAVLDFCSRLPIGVMALVVKPACEGSSCGISFCTSPYAPLEAGKESTREPRLDHIVKCIEQAFAFDSAVIVQEAVSGTEITVAVLQDPDARAMPVVEIVTPQGAWYDYEHKYSAGGSTHIIPARLPDTALKLAQEFAVAVHCQLGCRDLSRIDLIVSHPQDHLAKHHLWFLEINTLPGFTATSLFPDAAKAASLSMPVLVRMLISNAWARSWVPSPTETENVADQPEAQQP